MLTQHRDQLDGPLRCLLGVVAPAMRWPARRPTCGRQGPTPPLSGQTSSVPSTSNARTLRNAWDRSCRHRHRIGVGGRACRNPCGWPGNGDNLRGLRPARRPRTSMPLCPGRTRRKLEHRISSKVQRVPERVAQNHEWARHHARQGSQPTWWPTFNSPVSTAHTLGTAGRPRPVSHWCQLDAQQPTRWTQLAEGRPRLRRSPYGAAIAPPIPGRFGARSACVSPADERSAGSSPSSMSAAAALASPGAV